MPYFLRDLKSLTLFHHEQYFPKDQREGKCFQALFGFCCFKGFFFFFIPPEQLFNKSAVFFVEETK